MASILLYLVVYPLIFIIGVIDSLIGLFKKNKTKDTYLPPKDAVLSKLVDSKDPYSPYRSTLSSELFRVTDPNINLFENFKRAATKFADSDAFGIRELIKLEDEVQEDGKVFKKKILSKEYKWVSYKAILNRVMNFSNGLLKIGIKSEENIILFSETRPEWMISAFSCFRISVPVVTQYATLGTDALAFGVEQTQTRFLIASGETIQKIEKIIDRIPTVKYVIVFTDKSTQQNVDAFKSKAKHIDVFTIDEVEEIGRTSEAISSYLRPKKDDIAIIMYTSGSTGNPKGVMITHGNMITALTSLSDRLLFDLTNNDVLVAYLPLAHVLELCAELACINRGTKIGYSSPFTLTDNSTAIKKGELGDLRVLKPTVMAAVPIVLERICKAVKDKIGKESQLKQDIFRVAFEKKLKKVQSGKPTTLLDKIVFNKISEAVNGGRIRIMLSGGALLNSSLQEFAQVALCPVIQGYGLTETCGASCTQLLNQKMTGQVGSVVQCCQIKLFDWPEANYKATDKPNPRGEIWIGGDNVTLGYYKMPEKTAEDYHVIDGVRYFATGDIGEVLPSGDFKIIDRKKDLVKLQGGEYVSLNKVESVIKLMPIVDNCCVIADPSKSYCVCLVSPNPIKVEEYISFVNVEIEVDIKKDNSQTQMKNIKKTSEEVLDEFMKIMDENKEYRAKFEKEILNHCLKNGLERFESPTKVKFVKEQWLPDTGLVTDSMKLKRKEIEKFYKKEIEILYK